MKQSFLIAFLFAAVAQVKGQYFYSDILSTKQTNQLYRQLMTLDYRRISAASFEGTNEPSKDFVLEQNIDRDGGRIVTRSASIGNTESYFTGYYRSNRIDKTVDSGGNAINTVSYRYDNGGKVTAVSSESRDFDGTFSHTEVHLWSYNDKGQPQKMLKIKDGTDTTIITFTMEDENVAEEKWTRNNREVETWFYYYNPKKLLTDVVRYNRKARAMLPDYIFDYDNAGHVIQMTQTQAGAANYLVWRYTYNDDGLKTKEVAYNKQKELLGRVEYSYRK